MSLRLKSFLIVGSVFFLSVISMMIVANSFIIQGLLGAEQKEVSIDVKRAENAMDQQRRELEEHAWELSRDSSAYELSRRAASINNEQLSFDSQRLSNLTISLYLILDKEGNAVYSKYQDQNAGKMTTVPEDLIANIKKVDQIKGAGSDQETRSSLISHDGKPVLIAFNKLTRSDGTGNSGSILVVAKIFGSTEQASLSETTDLDIFISEINSKDLTSDMISAGTSLAQGQRYVVKALDSERVAGYVLIKEAENEAAFILKAETSRDTFMQGVIFRNYAFILLVILALLASLTAYVLMDKVVVRRLSLLGSAVKKIGETKDFQERLEVKGNDELAVLAHDINRTYGELENAKNDLTESEDLFRNISVSAMDGILMIDKAGMVVYLNEAAKKVFGKEKDDALELLRIEDFIIDSAASNKIRSFAQRASDLDNLVYGKTFESIANRNKDQKFPIEISLSATKVKGEWNALAIIRDISERQALELVRHIARHDELTDLPNRLYFGENLRRALSNGKRQNTMVAVHYFDIDHFKDINDTLGHELGDHLLLSVSSKLRKTIRKEDSLARLSGDKFAFIQENFKNVEQASVFAEKMLRELNEEFDIDGDKISITASIGISIFDPSNFPVGKEIDPAIFLSQADTALFKAKNEGKNNFQFFDESASKIIESRMSVLKDLRKALDNNEFCLFYQPQIDARTGGLFGAEALIRWKHPEKGLVFPGDFINIAEASGLIIPIGEWVLKEACRQAVVWQNSYGQNIHVGVNVSVIQFNRINIVELVKTSLAETGLAPELLNIEITESHLIANAEKTIKILNEIHEMGVSISLDDFGTGYSSLSYLDQFHVDYLKIDRQFVSYIGGEDNNDGAIAAATIALGHSLGIDVVAEGVETQAQLEFLQTSGCDHIQGYFFSKPVPAEEFTNFFGKSLANSFSN